MDVAGGIEPPLSPYSRIPYSSLTAECRCRKLELDFILSLAATAVRNKKKKLHFTHTSAFYYPMTPCLRRETKEVTTRPWRELW